MYATYNGHLDSVRLLAEKESRAVNAKGETALAIALQRGFKECAEILAHYEADVKILGMEVADYCAEVQPGLQGNVASLAAQAAQN